MTDVELSGRRVFIRADLNVPIANGEITSDTRIRASLVAIETALAADAAVMVTSHLGRPAEGQPDSQFSMAPVAKRLGELLDRPVRLVQDWIDGVAVEPGEAVLLENVRFLVGEKACDDVLSRQMASLCDVFVMDAFGTAHRAQASTVGIAKYATEAVAGPLLAGELEALAAATEAPARPVVAIVGGSKVSTKLTVLESLKNKVETLVVGGGIANTFIMASGHAVGTSLCEADLASTAARLLHDSDGAKIPVPVDVVCASEFSAQATARHAAVEDVRDDEMILDIGPQTAEALASILADAGTIVWNGPVGVFEFDAFVEGTETIGRAIADSSAFSIAGGGDTLAAIEKFGLADQISYISTGGGAFLEFLEGKTLPAVAILAERSGDLAC